jgi:DNA sulfur modification protein DndC
MSATDAVQRQLGDATLNAQVLSDLRKHIIRLYKQDDRPWVIGYSGGKDSTAVVQLIWDALLELSKTQELKKFVHILSSDTLVETPVVVDALRANLKKMGEAALAQGIPVTVDLVAPPANQSFWVNLIGRGYPAPTTTFRWCTDRLKIQPANKFILDTVSRHGEAILVLGVRKEESSTRAQSIELHANKAAEPDFSVHSSLPGALVFAPIVDWTTHDIWDFLGSAIPPWGGSHRELITMYRNAQAGDCPLVVDKSTSSCGNSRFGCWTCTVVAADKSMEALADAEDGSGEWLDHLLGYRDFLMQTTIPINKHKYRQHRRRDGSVRFKNEESSVFIWGPYQPKFRAEMLRRLLEAETSVRTEGPDPTTELITDAELLRIREIWAKEPEPEFFTLSVEEILAGASKREIAWPKTDDFGSRHQEQKVLLEVAEETGVPSDIMTRLLRIEEEARFSAKRYRIHQKIGAALASSWQSTEDILEERQQRRLVEEKEQENEN